MDPNPPAGRLCKAPENFLGREGVAAVQREAQGGRRDFIRSAFAAAVAGAAVPVVGAQLPAGDPNILQLPEHTRGLGQGVATDGYGRPSKFEVNVQRRPSPGLTQTTQSSVSFAPLQSLFGIVTPSGLQYRVITVGTGRKPYASDQVTVHYRGTLVDGTEFDSSIRRNEPATFPVGGVISGWIEALQMMPEGSKWELVTPANLAYGSRGAGGAIPPDATLIFEVELIKIR